jgi:hypothetical protein
MLLSIILVVSVGGSTFWGMKRWLNHDKQSLEKGARLDLIFNLGFLYKL